MWRRVLLPWLQFAALAQFAAAVIVAAATSQQQHSKALHPTAKSGIQFVLQPHFWSRRFLRQVSLVLGR